VFAIGLKGDARRRPMGTKISGSPLGTIAIGHLESTMA
jgi:hypothetical protein